MPGPAQSLAQRLDPYVAALLVYDLTVPTVSENQYSPSADGCIARYNPLILLARLVG